MQLQLNERKTDRSNTAQRQAAARVTAVCTLKCGAATLATQPLVPSDTQTLALHAPAAGVALALAGGALDSAVGPHGNCHVNQAHNTDGIAARRQLADILARKRFSLGMERKGANQQRRSKRCLQIHDISLN
jgi:hypothetical protein